MNEKKLKIYSQPKHVKLCAGCGKEISARWQSNFCENCQVTGRIIWDSMIARLDLLEYIKGES